MFSQNLTIIMGLLLSLSLILLLGRLREGQPILGGLVDANPEEAEALYALYENYREAEKPELACVALRHAVDAQLNTQKKRHWKVEFNALPCDDSLTSANTERIQNHVFAYPDGPPDGHAGAPHYEKYFRDLLKQKAGENIGLPIPKLTKRVAQKLLKRIENVKLYAHVYTFALNFRYGFTIFDLLNFAYEEGLQGVNCHIVYLKGKTDQELKYVISIAKKLELEMSIELSTTEEEDVNEAARIAKVMGIKNIRVYVRYPGHLDEIIEKAIEDLKLIAEVAEENDLQFVLEPHEVLKSNEFLNIIKEVNSPRVNLLFDFGNMINANEEPLPALQDMSPYIQQVHLKGVRRVQNEEKTGYSQVGVRQGKGDLPQMKMIFDNLLLGDSKSQVIIYALEQEVGYESPPFRFNGEGPSPSIPERERSKTLFNSDYSIPENLRMEIRNARNQVQYVRNVLAILKTFAEMRLEDGVFGISPRKGALACKYIEGINRQHPVVV
ncbi:MAG: TIM barrel protein [Candidatus Poribacteria bacterium]|nr:TIM barrel protein [Candidatus Poribacteria bacterium]